MPSYLHFLAHVLQAIFLIGVAGCLISIPIIAVKFGSVLFERDEQEEQGESGERSKNDDDGGYSELK